MNALLNLWATLSGLANSLARTKELTDLANTRLETALGLNEPAIKLIEAPAENETPHETNGRRRTVKA